MRDDTLQCNGKNNLSLSIKCGTKRSANMKRKLVDVHVRTIRLLVENINTNCFRLKRGRFFSEKSYTNNDTNCCKREHFSFGKIQPVVSRISKLLHVWVAKVLTFAPAPASALGMLFVSSVSAGQTRFFLTKIGRFYLKKNCIS